MSNSDLLDCRIFEDEKLTYWQNNPGDKMKYMMLLYSDEKKWETLTAEQTSAIVNGHKQLTAELIEKNLFVDGQALQPPNVATTVSHDKGKAIIIDGPFAETKEQLGGYYLCECKDLDQAIEIAKRIPSADNEGKVEIRPVWENPE